MPAGDTNARWAADKTHRGHAIIEQVHADLKGSALAHLPLKSFAANAARLVLAVIAFNLTGAAAALSGPALAKATTGTIRRTLIGVPTRIAASATNAETARTDRVALANPVDRAVHPDLRTTTDHLIDRSAALTRTPRSRQAGGPAAPDRR